MYLRLLRARARIGALTLAAASWPAYAHHGGAVEWQQSVHGPVTGIATDFAFRFPHVTVFIDVSNDGATENWAVTTRWTPTILRQHGWTRNSIKPGDTVTATYAPHVTKSTVVQMRTIEVNDDELPLQF